jgi:hypothetical protein
MANGFKTLFAAIGIICTLVLLLWLVTGHSEPDAQVEQTDQSVATSSAAPVATAISPLSEPNPRTASYHSTDGSVLSCDDAKITAEMQDAADHPGNLSDSAFGQLFKQGNCAPQLPDKNFIVTRMFEYQVAAGIVKMAEAEERISDGSSHTFYVLQNRIVLNSK